MPYYSVKEGEGVAGPLPVVSAGTTGLDSCMGIVFYSSHHRVAGLYHYGANTIKQELTRKTILQMINDLQPDNVYVTAPPVARLSERSGMGSTVADRRAVDKFLTKHAGMAGASVEWMRDQTWSNYGAVDGRFVVNRSELADNETRRTISMATQMPTPNGRQIGGNTAFYGGIGPRAGVPSTATDDTVLAVVHWASGRNVFG